MFMYVFLYYPDCDLQCGLHVLHAAPAIRVDISGDNININFCACLTTDLK
jgi:hypothetical protein